MIGCIPISAIGEIEAIIAIARKPERTWVGSEIARVAAFIAWLATVSNDAIGADALERLAVAARPGSALWEAVVSRDDSLRGGRCIECGSMVALHGKRCCNCLPCGWVCIGHPG